MSVNRQELGQNIKIRLENVRQIVTAHVGLLLFKAAQVFHIRIISLYFEKQLVLILDNVCTKYREPSLLLQ